MSEETKVPNTVREAIREGLGNNWSKDLEDALFYPIAGFVDRSYSHAFERGQQATLENLREAGVLPKL